ncbi:hypothetical protein J3E73DRAFT_183995, partial [Bipolaris maydis]
IQDYNGIIIIYEDKGFYGSNIISHPAEHYWVLKRLLRWTYKHEPLKTRGREIREVNVTVPTEVILSELGKGKPLGGNTTITMVAPHPVVGTQCWESSVNNNSEWNHSWPWISLIPDLPTLISKLSDTVELSIYDWEVDEEYSTLVYFSPVWMSSPEPVDHPLLVVFFRGITDEIWNQSTLVKPGLLSSMIESQGSDEFVTVTVSVCAISAHWNSGEVQSHYNGVYTLSATGQSSLIQQSAYRKISLDIAGDHPMRSAKFLSTLMGMLEAPHLVNLWLGGVLASALAIWLAKVPTLASVKQPHGLYPYEFFADKPPHKNIEDYTPYKTVYTTYGYGYGMQSTSVHLSMAVLLLYCVITIGYMLYTFATGSASTAWTSGVELLALALQSKRPDHLGHIGVGIDSTKTLGESVGIRVNADNEVELVFAHDWDLNTRGLQKVKQNTEY